MNVYCDDYVWVVAESPEDAEQAYAETFGDRHDDPEFKLTDWAELDDDELITIMADKGSTTLTAAEWVEKCGRGFLCTGEW